MGAAPRSYAKILGDTCGTRPYTNPPAGSFPHPSAGCCPTDSLDSSASLFEPSVESDNSQYGRTAVARRCRAIAIGIGEVSHVIHLRPQRSEINAVVAPPQVGSNTKSPGSVAIRIHRSITLSDVCTTYLLSPGRLTRDQMLVINLPGTSSSYRFQDNTVSEPAESRRFSSASLSIPSADTAHWRLDLHFQVRPSYKKGSDRPVLDEP